MNPQTHALTPHFTLAEFTRSARAAQLGLDNTPPPELLPALTTTAEMLERIRTTLGHPVVITSGYRSQAVNLAVGSLTARSDHVRGRAADIVSPGYGTPYQIAKRLAPLIEVLGIGQLILEGVAGKRWVHVSTVVPVRPVNRVITITDAGTGVGVQNVA